MNKKIIAIWLLFFSGLSQADILVEVHGYLGSSLSWERSGINAVLTQDDWQREGTLRSEPVGIVFRRDQMYFKPKAKNSIFNVDLPSQAPLWVQANQLIEMLKWIAKTHPKESIHLVGHSAGGVVARLAVLEPKVTNVKSLITIASPHMGTYRAREALNLRNNVFPIYIVKDFLTGGLLSTLSNSQGLLVDLLPPRKGTALAVINSRKHPEIRYVSIVRTLPGGLSGDALVPGLSQNMNSISVLSGRSEVVYTPTQHELALGDGATLLNILK